MESIYKRATRATMLPIDLLSKSRRTESYSSSLRYTCIHYLESLFNLSKQCFFYYFNKRRVLCPSGSPYRLLIPISFLVLRRDRLCCVSPAAAAVPVGRGGAGGAEVRVVVAVRGAVRVRRGGQVRVVVAAGRAVV